MRSFPRHRSKHLHRLDVRRVLPHQILHLGSVGDAGGVVHGHLRRILHQGFVDKGNVVRLTHQPVQMVVHTPGLVHLLSNRLYCVRRRNLMARPVKESRHGESRRDLLDRQGSLQNRLERVPEQSLHQIDGFRRRHRLELDVAFVRVFSHVRVLVRAEIDAADRQRPDHLLDFVDVVPGRGGEREQSKLDVAFPELLYHLRVSVFTLGAVRLVDHQTHNLVRGTHAVPDVVIHRLRCAEEDALLAPQRTASAVDVLLGAPHQRARLLRRHAADVPARRLLLVHQGSRGG